MGRSASGSSKEGNLPITSITLNTGVKLLQILPLMPKVCYSLLFKQSRCLGLKFAIVSLTLQLSCICILRAYSNLLVAFIRFRGIMSTAGYGQGIFHAKQYFPNVEKRESFTRPMPPMWPFGRSGLNPLAT